MLFIGGRKAQMECASLHVDVDVDVDVDIDVVRRCTTLYDVVRRCMRLLALLENGRSSLAVGKRKFDVAVDVDVDVGDDV